MTTTKAPKAKDRIEDIFSLSPLQEGLLFHALYAPEGDVYAQQQRYILRGALEPNLLREAWQRVSDRHQPLRSAFVWKGRDRPLQVVFRKVLVEWQEIDLLEFPEAERGAQIEDFLAQDVARGFDCARPPLSRLTLLRLEPQRYLFVWSFHHVILDGWSVSLVLREVLSIYGALAVGRTPRLPPPRPYGEYISWLRSQKMDRAEDFWRRRLAGFSRPTRLSIARGGEGGAGDTDLKNSLPGDVVTALRGLASRHRLTLNTLVQGAWGLLLSRYSGERDVVFGATVSGRPPDLRGVEDMVGLLINTQPVRVHLPPSESMVQCLARLQAEQLETRQYEYTPLVDIRRWSEVSTDQPLFDTLLVFENFPSAAEAGKGSGGPIRVESAESREGTNYPLALMVGVGAVLGLRLFYDPNHFERTDLVRLLGHFKALLRGLVESPEGPVAARDLLGVAERQQLLAEWNDTDLDPRHGPVRSVWEHFEERVHGGSESVALDFEGRQLSFQELGRQARGLAQQLIQLGVHPEDRVGVCLGRGEEMVVALLAVLRAGAAYVPLDPALPEQRLAFMLEDSRASLVLTRGAAAGQLPETGQARIVHLGEDTILEEAEVTLPPSGDLDRLAYVIYTSGSTGRPKGVQISHRSLGVFLHAMTRAPGFGGHDTLLALTTISFDIAGLELFLPLIHGARLVLGGADLAGDGAELTRRLLKTRTTVMQATPATWRLLTETEAFGVRGLRALCGGEALPGDLASALVDRDVELWNLYGPTEATVWSAVEHIRRARDGVVEITIGQPIAGTRIHVVDRDLALAPLGVVGELCIAGAGLSRGYLARPALTATKFVANPFGRTAGERLYRTGDLARTLPDGRLDCLGRIDHQVKVRGFRIELGEIETALAEHPGVRYAATVIRSGAGSGASLVAFLVPEGEEKTSPRTLRDFLGRRLPDYMIPSLFVFRESLPLTPNGKVDRGVLGRLAVDAAGAREARYQAPRTPFEEMLATVWTEVLGRTEGSGGAIGIHDNFFELGGHSLLATRVVTRVRSLFGVELPLRAVFQAPTIANLGERIELGMRQGLDAETQYPEPQALEGPTRSEAEDIGGLPLSFAQQRLWFLDQLEPAGAAYNIPLAVRLVGTLEKAVLERALEEMIRRHESLRTIFEAPGGEPRQVIQTPDPRPLPCIDLSGLEGGGALTEALRLRRSEALKPFDLKRGPLLRVQLLRLAEDDHVVLSTMHHIISDGRSMEIFLRELVTLYRAFLASNPSPLPDLPVRYVDYARWQRTWLSEELLESQLAYWREQLAESPVLLELPTDRPRPPVQSTAGASVDLRLGREATEALEAWSRATGSTLFMTVLAGFQLLLARLAGVTDLTVGTPIAGRNRLEVEGVLGLFVNTLVLRARPLPGTSGKELLSAVRETALGAYAHQDLPFEQLVQALQPERSLGHSPLFQVLLTLEMGRQEEAEASDLRMEGLGTGVAVAKFDLELALSLSEGRLSGSLVYCRDLFDATTMQRMLRCFEGLLANLATEPERAIETLPLLGSSARHQLLVEWNDAAQVAEEGADGVHQLVSAQAQRFPEAIAVVRGGRALSYGALIQGSNRVARHLQSLGVGPEQRLGLCMRRDLEMVVGLLGILGSGAAYVPLDPAYPVERLRFMVADAGVDWILTEEGVEEVLPEGPARLDCGQILRGVSEDGAGFPVNSAEPGHLAYVIYTSGSTGRPKGVGIEHRSALALIAWAQRTYSPHELSTVAAVTSICFDLSIFELWATLSAGGRVWLVDDALALNARDFQGITLLNTVPSVLAELLRVGGVPSSVRTINLAGEPLRRALVDRIHDALGGVEVWNLYGPSEDTTYSTAFRSPLEDRGEPAIGRPLPGTRAHVVGVSFSPLPPGVVGELYLGGAGLSRGYLGRPSQTAESFVPDPWSEVPGARLYGTGDRVRFLADGNLEFLGRRDHQVKVRGFRIELGEIESAMLAHPGIAEAAVLVRETPSRPAHLVAYVVGEPTALDSLLHTLATQLPAHMVPSSVAALDVLPQTPSGKVDRSALGRLGLPATPRRVGGKQDAPRGPSEELLASIWCEVLGLESLGIHDNFFELGGHSLLATRVLSRVRSTFGVELSLRAFFEAPTVATAGARIDAARRAEGTPQALPLERVDRGSVQRLPLSFAQERLWFLDQLELGASTYNIPLAVRLRGTLSLPLLGRCLDEVVTRQEVLRTVFTDVDGEPFQVIQPPTSIKLPVIDLSALSEPRRAQEVLRQVAAEVGRGFDLARGPLLRGRVLRLGERDHVVQMTLHHIVSDAWSVEILLSELAQLYGAFGQGEPSPLPELAVHYADFAAWQRRNLSGEVLEGEIAHWRERLAGAPPVLELPTDRPRPPMPSRRGGSHGLHLESDGLLELGRQHDVTLFMTLLAGFQALLLRWSGSTDVVVGAPIAGRNRMETEELIGFFVNTLVLRTDLSGDPSFEQLLQRAREVALEAHAHQDLPFEKVVAELEPERNLNHTPLFQVLLVLQNVPPQKAPLSGDLEMSPFPMAGTSSKFDLTLSLAEGGERLHGALTYATDLFDATTMARFGQHLGALLEAVAEDPGVRLSAIPLLSPGERHQLLREWAGTPGEGTEGGGIHHLFEYWADQTPEAPALIYEDLTLTYGELEERANRLAHYMRRLGVGPEQRVALRLERSPQMLESLLGVLKAGGTYIPLESDLPMARQAFVLKDAAASWILSDGVGDEGSFSGTQEISLAEAGPEIAAQSADRWMESPVGAGNLAYVLYTSGSTGQPKGVGIEHQQLLTYVGGVHRRLNLPSGASFATVSTLAADLGNTMIFGAWKSGGPLHLIARHRLTDAEAMVEYFGRRRVDCLKLVPSHLGALLTASMAQQLLPRRLLVLGGESASQELIERVRTLDPALRILNHYGPTEATIGVSTYEVKEKAVWGRGGGLPLGRPLLERRTQVLDDHFRPLPLGIPGELCLGGAGLARAYLGRPRLTAERFVPDPFHSEPGARLYRTGDRALYSSQGLLEFLGRRDHQLKIRGFRIEPGEVESALREHPAVADALAVGWSEGGDSPSTALRLAAYAVRHKEHDGEMPEAESVRSFLARRLPDPMIPSTLLWLDEWPRTPNGKIDRRALPDPEFSASSAEHQEMPAGPVEEMVAEVWAQVLGRESGRIGRHDNFFELGGHSLLATQVLSRIRAAFGVELELRVLFEAPSVAAMGQHLEDALGREDKLPAIRPLPEPRRQERFDEGLPLSFSQQRLWFIDRMDPGNPTYNIPIAVRIRGDLDVEVLAGSLRAVMQRHEVLRTAFPSHGGEPRQVVQPVPSVGLRVVDLGHLDAARQRQEGERLARGEARHRFDLRQAPLLRFLVVRLAREEHLVFLTLHHIISDGWSRGLLIGELTAHYGRSSDRSAPPDLPVQYGDFAVWQREWLLGEVLDAQMAYWRERLANLPPRLELATDHPRPPVMSFRGGRADLRLSSSLSDALRQLSRRSGATLFMTLLGAFEVLLSRHSGQRDFCVGTPIAGRNRLEIEGLIGFFVNSLVLRSEVRQGSSFESLLEKVRETTLAAHAHQDLPFEKLVEELRPERSQSHTPLFQVMLAWQVPTAPIAMEALQLEPLDLGSATSKFDLSLTLGEGGGRLRGSLEYSADLFEATTITRLLERFTLLLEGIVQSPAQDLDCLPLLRRVERHALLYEGNDTARGFEEDSLLLHELFEQTSLFRSESVAVVSGVQHLTFEALSQRSTAVASELESLGVGAESPVGLYLERSCEMVVGMLGVLKASAAYVPLDTSYPEDRLAYMVEDAGIEVLLNAQPGDEVPAGYGGQVLSVASLDWAGEPIADGLRSQAWGESPAYILYTSGSTGRPKGVMIPHRAICNHMQWMLHTLPFGPDDHLLQKTAFSFDASVWEFWGPLLAGGRLVMASASASRDPRRMVAELLAGRITILQAVPSLLQLLLEEPEFGETVLNWVLCGGEALSGELWRRFFEHGPRADLVNGYGPTEAAIHSSVARWKQGDSDSRITIGRALSNVRLYLLGPDLKLVPPGCSGRLYVGGRGLARGYLGRPGLTAERFVPDALGNEAGGRLYDTGDLCRHLEEGSLAFLGRADHQVKVRGFRVELGEIEAQLEEHERVSRGVLVLSGQMLVAHVLIEDEGKAAATPPTVSEFRAFLAERVPEFMVPSIFLFPDHLPLSPSGKVDRGALARSSVPQAPEGEDAVAARTLTEELLLGIWSAVLGREVAGVEHNFFELGGHSLLTVQVLSRIRSSFGVEIAMRSFFEGPTVSELSVLIDKARSLGERPSAPALRPMPESLRQARFEKGLPLSFSQQRLWFLDRMGAMGAYNIPLAVRVLGRLDAELFERSLNELVRRHEVLRTVFTVSGGEPVQVILPTPKVPVPLVDLCGLETESRQRLARHLVASEAGHPFDLAQGPLLRARIFRLEPTEHLVLITLHHIVSDGWSQGILISELAALYGAFASGSPSPLAELPIQYVDFAMWQRDWLRGEVLEGEVGYWRQQLEGAPAVLDLPVDRPRPSVQNQDGAACSIALSPELFASLEHLSRRHGVTLFMTLLGAFEVLLSRHSGQWDFCLGTPIAGRHRLEIEGLIGFFVNSLVLRSDVQEGLSFDALLGRVRETILGAHAHQDLPFEKLVEELSPERSQAHTPLFQVMFAWRVPSAPVAMESLHLEPLALASETSKFDLSLTLGEGGGGLRGSLEYRTELFDSTTIRRLLERFTIVLEGIAHAPNRELAHLPLLRQVERHALLLETNDTTRKFEDVDRLLHESFDETSRRHPESVAVVSGTQHLTFDALSRRSTALASRLEAAGVEAESAVGLYLERSCEMVVGMLGVLKASAAYVPLDTSYPADRLHYMVEDAGIQVLLNAQPGDEIPSGYLGQVLSVASSDGLPLSASTFSSARASLESPAYILYTSGSTGRPKGVVIPHHAICNHMLWMLDTLPFGREDHVLQKTASSFDASVWEFWGPLLAGGRLVMASTVASRDPHRMVAELIARRITILQVVPSLLQALLEEPEFSHTSLRWVLSGGEALLGELWRRFFEKGPRAELINGYGPTEATIHSSMRRWREGRSEPRVSIGRALSNARLYLLGPHLELVPPGSAGRLYIGGRGLARGYLGQPGLTAERFIPDALGGKVGARLYDTGDLCRFLADGSLVFLGRVDHQVKLRGFRLELGEIETQLERHPQVSRAVLVVQGLGVESSRQTLVAHVVAVGGAGAGSLSPKGPELQKFLAERLPEFMVPSVYVFPDRLPLTPSGKVDRGTLARTPIPQVSTTGNVVEPRTLTEEMLLEIWSEVLGREVLGIEDNFFELGGHSLLTVQVLSRVRSIFGVELAMGSLFDRPMVSGLGVLIDEARERGERPSAPAIRPLPEPLRQERFESGLPLSFSQQRLWFIDRVESVGGAYNIPLAARVTGSFDVELFRRSLSEIVRRHEVLRTVFVTRGGEPVQRLQPAREVDVELVDLGGLGDESNRSLAHELAVAEVVRPFDLVKGPLLRAKVLLLGPSEHLILVTLHHIVFDGWSQGILLSELAALYGAFAAGRPSPLEELPIQYADFALWQREWLQGEVLEGEIDYWRQELEGAPTVLELPTDRPRPSVQSLVGSECNVHLPLELLASLQNLNRRHGVTLFMTLLSAFEVLLYRWTGQRDLSLGTPVAGRHRLETEGLIGFFVNTLVLRCQLTGQTSFPEFLEQMREVTLGAHSHQDLPYDRLVEELVPERSLAHWPLFQVMFTVRPRSLEEKATWPGNLQLSAVELPVTTAKFDLTLVATEGSEGLSVQATYRTDLLDETTIRRLLGQYRQLLEGVVEETERRLDDLSLLPSGERHQLLVEWNESGEEWRGGACVHELFETCAQDSRDAIALSHEGRQMTYGELDRRSTVLAQRLEAIGVGSESRVVVYMRRSPELITGILGILKAGGAYVPVDPSYPRERVDFLLEDCRPHGVVSEPALADGLSAFDGPVLQVTSQQSPDSTRLSTGTMDSENLAYVIYTSGSTGLPKGVEVSHRGLLNLVRWHQETYSTSSLDRATQLASLSFDAAVWEIWPHLLAGSRLCLVGDAIRGSVRELRDWLVAEGITITFLPTPLLEQLLLEPWEGNRAPRHILTGGDQLHRSASDELPFQLVNHYGPTESSVVTTRSVVRPHSLGTAAPPIGRPISGVQIYLVDSRLRQVPLRAAGELVIGGAGLARGYLGRPRRSAESFVPDPLSGEPGARLYRTGDFARFRTDGEVEFLGRRDQQIKLRGFRIELGEIESALLEPPGVREGVVVLHSEGAGGLRLVAYVVGEEADSGDLVRTLRAELSKTLPDYMVPSAFIPLEALPLTPNGKVDRANLASRPLPTQGGQGAGAGIAPRDSLELSLVQLWEELLGVEGLGVQDDFFALGGHSLLAVRLQSAVEELVGRSLELSAFFKNPTIEALASELRSGPETVEKPSPLVALRSQGTGTPFFCVHPVGGTVYCYLPLVRHLDPEQSFYALQSPALFERSSVGTRLEELAGLYCDLLRTVQVHGPYRLGGWSLGGVIAFEMARQLHAQGEVAHLILIDSQLPSGARGSLARRSPLERVFAFARDLGLDLTPLKSRAEALEGLAVEELLETLYEEALREQIIPPDLGLAKIQHLFEIFEGHVEALEAYVPQVHDGDAVLLRAQESGQQGGEDPSSRWRHWLQELTIRDVPGTHYTLMREPLVKDLADHLTTLLTGSD